MKNKMTIEAKKTTFLQELKNALGIKALACKKTGIGRTMLYQYLNNDPDFAQQVVDIEESFKDYVEGRFFQEYVLTGDRAAMMFYLKAKAKDRGYR
ncbi:hypothetical protein [Mucilaginibacter sp. KACC 22063]|uniref:hypothetical protein n=1 Tax=Mucilaginibacter sp. KACC 22063 TaxID=3025666 RepID=UPI002365C742|nr:hypothetical protein [Mucilaginibacter sp. KACC 22063]WDF55259.1 hypothetical protein PQ461_20205 [Mucilaginibacter sp. KACC 22063]